MVKKYIIIGGINGAGKSSFFRLDTLKKDSILKGSIRVNPDEILQSFGKDWRDTSAQLLAARQAAKMLKTLINGEASFHRETILSGNLGAHKVNISRAKANGFYIHLIYIALESVECAKQRISQRVNKGGHGIPDEIVERRYLQSLQNLKEILPLVDEVDIFDNSTNGLKLVYSRNARMEIDKSDQYPYLASYIKSTK